MFTFTYAWSKVRTATWTVRKGSIQGNNVGNACSLISWSNRGLCVLFLEMSKYVTFNEFTKLNINKIFIAIFFILRILDTNYNTICPTSKL